MLRTLFTTGAILILTTSCQQRFNSEKWKIEKDLRTYPFRDGMVADIIESKTFIGLQYQQAIDSLGQPSAPALFVFYTHQTTILSFSGLYILSPGCTSNAL